MKCKTVLIVNKLGMHARASAKFVNLASSFRSEVTLDRAGRRVNGKSIMGIMMLAAGRGTQLELCASGDDEDEALLRLGELIRNRFGEGE